MLRRAVIGAWLTATVACTVGCGPGLLPDLGFGTADGETGSGTAGTASSDDATTPGTTGNPPPWGDSFGDEGDSEGDGDSEGSTSTTNGTNSGPDGGDSMDGPDGDGDADAEWGGDTWGIPPDVTNEPCDPLLQDCFPTHKCVPFATQPGSPFLDANKCMPILGDKPWGEPCTLSNFNEAQDDCDGEGFCWNLEWIQGQLHGTCVPFCVGTPQNLTCPLGWGCLFTGAIALCEKQCAPLIQDCPVDYGCYWTGNGFDCQLIGTPAGPKQACDLPNDCLPGLACVDKAAVPGCQGNDPNCCTEFCDLSAPDTCAPPLSCVSFFAPNQAPPMLVDIGVCIQA